MTTKKVVVGLEDGLEAKVTSLFVQAANDFRSRVYVIYKGRRISAQSYMGMTTLSLAPGETVEIEAEGPDEEAAVDTLVNYLGGKAE